jgi:cytochrome c oxidase cbb3-type subunit 3
MRMVFTDWTMRLASGFNMRLILLAISYLLATAVNAAPDGAELFAKHCAVCHGDDGGGGVGTPLALPSFLESVDDDFLRKTIRLGRPGRVMPAFPKLSDAQLEALVGHIRAWSGKPAPEFSATPVKGDSQHGKALFASHCAGCHGVSGEGGHGTGVTFSRRRDLPIIAPALNNAGFLSAATDNMIRHTLVYGREGTPMTSMLVAGLSEQDINDVVAYVRSLQGSQVEEEDTGSLTHEPVIEVESSYTLEETIENLKQSIAGENFVLIRTDYLEHGLVEEGKENRQEVILHFCNFNFLFKALAVDPRVGLFLPCRVTVVERDGKVLVSTINPLYLSRLFNNGELDEYCREMHDVYQSLIEDATL